MKPKSIFILLIGGWLCLGNFLIGEARSGESAKEEVWDSLETALLVEDFERISQQAAFLYSSLNDPNERARARTYQGISAFRQGRWDEADAFFLDARRLATKRDLQDRIDLGRVDVLLARGDYDEALILCRDMLRRPGSSSWEALARLKAGRALLRLTRWDEARAELQKIIHRYPKSFEARRARQLLEEKQYFSVQVGSFLNPERAQAFVRALQNQGEYAYIVETSHPDGMRFYRVRIGKMASLEEAQKLQYRLSDQGYPALIFP